MFYKSFQLNLWLPQTIVMKKLLIHFSFVIISSQCFAQKNPVIPVKDLIPAGVQVTITKGSNTIGGKKIDYTTHTGYLDLKNDTLTVS